MDIPRVALINDMSGFGRCSLTVAMPILSVMGAQCCPLPTAYLSSQTAIPGFTFTDMTGEMEKASAHWQALGLTFDAIYTGFLGSEAQIELIGRFIGAFRRPGTTVLVDPVMGDHGRTYRTYTAAMCEGMAHLAGLADIITPNITEAAMLLGRAPDEQPESEREAEAWAEALSLDGRRSVVITGFSRDVSHIGAMCFDSGCGRCGAVCSDLVDVPFHGAGDVFASVLLGALLRGANLASSAQLAADFVRDAARRSVAFGNGPNDGLVFEPLLGPLSGKL